MSKRKYKKQSAQLYERVLEMAETSTKQPSLLHLSGERTADASEPLLNGESSRSGASHELLKMGKFRFQLLYAWIVEHFSPCRVADIGGGKGLLAYLLGKAGWQATVIDPVSQELPDKFKDLVTDKRVRIAPTEQVPHIHKGFEPGMAKDFDLLVGIHAHGCNVKIIDAAAEYKRSFILLPCCIIDEPMYPPRGVPWLQSLVDYAVRKGFVVRVFRLNFSGQNIGFYGQLPEHEDLISRV